MKSELKRLFLVSAIAAASISMTACGGGGGGSDKPKTDPVTGGPAGGGNDEAGGTVRIQKTGKEVPKEDANLGRASGVWFHRYEIFEEAVPLDGEASAKLKHYGSQVQSVEYRSDTELVIDACSLEEPETMTIDSFRTSLVDESKIEQDEDAVGLPCEGEIDYQFYERSDTDYRVDMVCDGQLVGRSEMKQISAQPQYNNGSLSFQADSGESLTSTGGVCGMLFHATIEDNSTFKNLGLIEVVAPYEDTKLKLTMISFDGLNEGTYEITGTAGSEGAIVAIETASAGSGSVGSFSSSSISISGHTTDEDPGDMDDDFDDDFDDIDDGVDDGDIIIDDDNDDSDGAGVRIIPVGGTITIESLDSFSATGSFDLIQENESRVQGNFSLDMQ